MTARISRFDERFVEMAEGPCPFCGSHETGKMWHSGTIFGPMMFFVFCHSCHARGPLRDNPGDAVSAWNGAREKHD